MALLDFVLYKDIKPATFYGGKQELYDAPPMELTSPYFRALLALPCVGAFLPYALGVCYREGAGCRKDEEKAKQYFLLAAGEGNPYAKEELGIVDSKIRFARYALGGE